MGEAMNVEYDGDFFNSSEFLEAEQKPEFQEHFQRCFTPFKPGFAHVRSEDFVINHFEPYEEDMTARLTPEMLQLCRAEAVKCIDIMEKEFEEQLKRDSFRFLKEGTMPAWNARNMDELTVNLAAFCDMNIDVWEEVHFPVYKETCTVLDEAGLDYVRVFVGAALARMPYCIEDETEIYYDSDDTAVGKDD